MAGADRDIPGPYDPREMRAFLESFFYEQSVFLIDEVTELDSAQRSVGAKFDTRRRLPFASQQRVRPGHPAHVSGPEIVMITADLGSLHAWFFHGCRWDEGWVGFGVRIHRADFKALAQIGPPLILRSREIRSRAGSERIVIRFEFEFSQNGRSIYSGDQTAMFLKGVS